MLPNPFTPTFGSVPLYMAGREDIIEEIATALEGDAGDPNLVTLFSGARGTGKTALLTRLAEESLSRGWIAVNVTAIPGMLEEILQQVEKAASHLLDGSAHAKVTGVKIADALEFEIGSSEPVSPTWRIRMSDILDELSRFDTGLLITVDEIRGDLDEMIYLAATYQHFVREKRKVALLMAGLPSQVSTLLQDRSVSFLRRSNYCEIGIVDDFSIRCALKNTIEEGGRSIDEKALSLAVERIGGFPYLMQLVGYRAWGHAPHERALSRGDIEAGVERAKNDMKRKIFDMTFRELSKGDVRFLEAMLEDDGPSDFAEIAVRMGKKSNYVSEYKRRLIEAGVLEDMGQGMLRVEMPFFKDYLQERLKSD